VPDSDFIPVLQNDLGYNSSNWSSAGKHCH